ncbi:MAG TPA: PLP-dependent aspartate aminotransferase family protein [Gemmatimonadaceae bacterium]|nr:PLP-dependent aspartate aminotransferase family protein [Gemmatimonadaceae bacterium]
MPPLRRRHGLATTALHGGRGAAAAGTPLVSPIQQSVNFVQQIGVEDDARYPRYGGHPNAELLQQRLALLEGAEAALVVGSGMGATACALLALLRPGDHLVASAWSDRSTYLLLTRELEPMGIDVTLVDPHEPRGWRKAIGKKTRALYLESPVNPTCRLIDLKPVSHLAKDNGLALVVDSSMASPILIRPLEHGADVVVHSASRFLNGHGDAVLGVLVGTAPFVEEARQKMMVWGQAPDPFACWLLERGLKTLDVRMRRASDTAARVATWCATRPDIERVHYPGLEAHRDHELARSMMDGFGAILGFELANASAAARFLRRLKLVGHAPHPGGVETVICEPRVTSHAHLTAQRRAELGAPDGFLRLSVGLEDPVDLIADFEQALR